MKACEFAGLIHECSSEVLDAMYFATVLGSAPLETGPDTMPDAEDPLAFSLEFVGDISGRFGLELDKSTASVLAANFLGAAETDISLNDVTEVAGELANMLCGSVMSRVEEEHSFALSHPAGNSLAPSGAEDFLACVLETDSGMITVWIQVEGDTCLC